MGEATDLHRPGQLGPRSQDAANSIDGPIKLLTFTTLFPHAGRPTHGIFVENRLRHLVGTGGATSTVLSPVPWFPSRSPRFGDWAKNARAERSEVRNGIQVFRPRYAVLPRIGMTLAPTLLAASAIPQLRILLARGLDFDLIDAHYLYPDGVAAIVLGRIFRKPVVITARGSDITQYPDYPLPRRMIRWAMAQADALISVSDGLNQAMTRLGAPAGKTTTLRNGVNLDIFRPSETPTPHPLGGRAGPILLSVGHLIERKRHDLAIRALRDLSNWTLAIVGEGPEETALRRLTTELGLCDRVFFCGPQPHHVLPQFYTAAAVLILASSREGWANVLLESMACGTPVVASNIPGNAEVVASPLCGEVVTENTPACFAKTINRVFTRQLSRASVRSYAEKFGWDATSQGQLTLFRNVLDVFSRPTDQRSETGPRDDSS